MHGERGPRITWHETAVVTLLVLSWLAQGVAQDGSCNSIAGQCDAVYNVPWCSFDGGDCCICTCINNADCQFGVFDCLDPDAGDELYGCELTPLPPQPCLQDVEKSWIVKNSTQALAFAEAVTCSGGSFEVEWHGDVVIAKTINVTDGTVLNITGAGSSSPAGIDGGTEKRIFTVVNASLYLSNVRISSGYAEVGGAIAASMSMLTLNDTSFVNNSARGVGGAIFVTNGSSVLVSGKESTFVNNEAVGGDGGALFVSKGSVVSWMSAVSYFQGNTAGEDGGALAIFEASTVSWYGEAIFSDNTCARMGGAVYVALGSSVSWRQSVTFSFNTAYAPNASGGAMTANVNSSASWSGETIFIGNSAEYTGGALYAVWGSEISWNGETNFTDNSACYGGAVDAIEESNIIWTAKTMFAANSALNQGGALFVGWRSIVYWIGDTAFISNAARHHLSEEAFMSSSSLETTSYGGAIEVMGNSYAFWNSSTVFFNNTASSGGALSAHSNSFVVWDGLITFDSNSAYGVSGGAIRMEYSTVSWWGETKFANNTANASGGAVTAWYAAVSWSGVTVFFNNSAAEFSGGALAAFWSTISWTRKTTFKSNQADTGGAINAFESHVWWEAETNYSGNIASTSGGGMLVSNSTVSWNAETCFLNNSADSGGGITARTNSSVSWSGLKTEFTFNTASTVAGAILAEYCTLSWSGSTLFLNNSVDQYGGALFMFNKTIASWRGNTTFSGNAAANGGALYLYTSEPNFHMDGFTDFSHNYAGSEGGAMFIDTLDFVSGESPRVMVTGSVIFRNNSCGENGGALALLRTEIEFNTRDASFTGNSAKVAGGAIFLTGADIGPTFRGFTFVSNSAQLGGGVYITGSGNSRLIRTGEQQSNQVRFEECTFIQNEAEAMGGAMHTAAGQDILTNTSFVENKAGTGGALRLAGTATLDNCSFVENVSDEDGGAAVSNIGYISSSTSNSFWGNVYNCEPGTFLDFNESDDVYEIICDGCYTSCQECRFDEPPLVPLCTAVMEHSESPGGLTTHDMILIDPGYWRATSVSVYVMSCYNAKACLGGMTGTSEYCREGYEGPYCAVCSDGYTARIGFNCDKCSNNTGGMILAIVLAGAAVLVVIVVACYIVSGGQEHERKGLIERTMRYIPFQSLKIIIVMWQILTQFANVANVTYPNVYQRFLDSINVLNFDLGWVLSVGCILDLDFHGRLLFATIGPIVVVTMLGATYAIAFYKNRGCDQALRNVRHKHVTVVLLLTFLVYSSVSSILFQTFASDPLDDGKTYLRADYSIEYYSSKHNAFKIYAGLMIVLYPIGIPVLYAGLLFKDYGALHNNEVNRQNEPQVRSTSYLWKPYKPAVFYYELIECGRRILLTGVVVFIYPNTSSQIAITLILAFTFAMISEGFNPYISRWDTWINRVGHVVVFIGVYLALLLKVDVSGERLQSQELFEVVLVSMNVCLMGAVVVEALLMISSLNSGEQGASNDRPPWYRRRIVMPWKENVVPITPPCFPRYECKQKEKNDHLSPSNNNLFNEFHDETTGSRVA